MNKHTPKVGKRVAALLLTLLMTFTLVVPAYAASSSSELPASTESQASSEAATEPESASSVPSESASAGSSSTSTSPSATSAASSSDPWVLVVPESTPPESTAPESDPASLPEDGPKEPAITFAGHEYALRLSMPSIIAQLMADGVDMEDEATFNAKRDELVAEKMMQGVTAADEQGNAVEVTMQDDGGFTIGGEQNTFTVTYAATHPETEEVFTVTREVSIEYLSFRGMNVQSANVASEAALVAAIEAGETDIVLTGSFTITNTLNISGKNITINAASGVTITMNYAYGSRRHFYVDGGGSLTLGTNVTLDGGGSGGGVHVANGSLTLNGTITNCNAADGGGVQVGGGGSFTMNGTISNCHATSSGGGVSVANGGTLNMQGGTVTGCSAKRGGGIYTLSSNTTINGTISNNSASASNMGAGGGIYVGDISGQITVGNATITGNSAPGGYGGGIYIPTRESLNITGNINFSGNSAKEVVARYPDNPTDLAQYNQYFGNGKVTYDTRYMGTLDPSVLNDADIGIPHAGNPPIPTPEPTAPPPPEISYYVTVETTHPAKTTVSGAGWYLPGRRVDIGAAIKNNDPSIRFVGWEVVVGGVTLNNTGSLSTYFTMPANNVTVRAKFTEQAQYTLTVQNNLSDFGITNIPATGGGTYYVGEFPVINAGEGVPAAYGFEKWEVVSGPAVSFMPGNARISTMNMPEGDITVKGIFKPVFTVTYHGNGSTGGTLPGVDLYFKDATATVKAPGTLARTNYTFKGWALSEGAANAGTVDYNGTGSETFVITSNVDLWAVWQHNPVVTYDANGGSGTVPGPDIVAPLRAGYSTNYKVKDTTITINGGYFLGWNSSKAAADAGTVEYVINSDILVTSDITLYAVWKMGVLYTVIYDANGGTNPPIATDGVGGSNRFYNGNNHNIIYAGMPGFDMHRPGYICVGWSSSPTGTTNSWGANVGVGSDMTLYAIWQAKPDMTLTYDGNGHDIGNPPNNGAPITKQYDSLVTLEKSDMARANYTFLGWDTVQRTALTPTQTAPTIKYPYNANTETFAPEDFRLTANTTLYAVWRENPYTTLYYWRNRTATDTNKTAVKAYINADATLKTLEELQTIVGGAFAWPVAASETIVYIGWTDAREDGRADSTIQADYSPGDTIAIGNTQRDIYALYHEKPRYTLTYYGNGSTTNVPAPVTNIVEGGSVYINTATTMTRVGYSFEGWSTDPDATAEDPAYARGSTVSPVTHDIDLYAVWKEKDTYSITYDANGGINAPIDTSGISGTNWYYSGSTVQVKLQGSMTKLGHSFDYRWNTKADGTGTNYSPGIPTTLTSNLVLYAMWNEGGKSRLIYNGNGNTGGTAPVAVGNAGGDYYYIGTEVTTIRDALTACIYPASTVSSSISLSVFVLREESQAATTEAMANTATKMLQRFTNTITNQCCVKSMTTAEAAQSRMAAARRMGFAFLSTSGGRSSPSSP